MIDFVLKKSPSAGCNLWIPDKFSGLSEPELYDELPHSGGCGPGTLGDKLIPDSIWGLDITPACLRHDLSWLIASTYHDRVLSDSMFLCNMLLLNDKSNKLMRFFRLRAPFGIYNYYEAVAYLGN